MRLRKPKPRPSNTVSTRPVGKPPPRNRRRFIIRLSTLAAVLGLFATLWSTLIGQTVVDLLKSDQHEVHVFRQHIQAECKLAFSRLTFVDIGVSGLRGARFVLALKSPRNFVVPIGIIKKNRHRDVIARNATAAFAELGPPSQLASNYQSFITGWQNLTVAIAHAVNRPIMDPHATVNSAGGMLFSKPTFRGLRQRFRPIRRALDEIDTASIPLGVAKCFSRYGVNVTVGNPDS